MPFGKGNLQPKLEPNFLLTREMQSMNFKRTSSLVQLVFPQSLATCQGHCDSTPALWSLRYDRGQPQKGEVNKRAASDFVAGKWDVETVHDNTCMFGTIPKYF